MDVPLVASMDGSPESSCGVVDLLDITVLMGGPSAEREISLMSGTAIADALERLGHRVVRADISPLDASALEREGMDLVFIALHGQFGESGQVQTMCKTRDLRYIGSGPRASELAMDKAAAKQIFKRVGLNTPDWMVIEEFHQRSQITQWLAELPPPVVVKPVDGGSSIDVVIAHDEAARDMALSELTDKYGRAMVERFIPGREFTVGIVGKEVLPVLEIVPDGEFYDYRAKYSDDVSTRYIFDHGLSYAACLEMQDAALLAHRSLGCRDISRVDFILDGQGIAHVMEINTIPGFTSHSLLPMAAERIGISFDQFIENIVKSAMAR
jgi:D-alanine-D-alanine ligase